LYDFEYRIECDDDAQKWSITLYNMDEKSFNKWVVLIMQLRDFLIEKEGR
jgi:hypothetical protein